jgi:hypothetical protein
MNDGGLNGGDGTSNLCWRTFLAGKPKKKGRSEVAGRSHRASPAAARNARHAAHDTLATAPVR